MKLTTDHGFKTVFGTKHEDLLLSFVNGVFEGRKKIVKITYLPLKQLGRLSTDRDTIFDLYCRDELGGYHIVEMQVATQKHFMERGLFYAAVAIQMQAKKGKWNFSLKPLSVITIVNFKLWEDNTDCINCFSLMNEKTMKKASDKLQFITIELPKFNKSLSEMQTDLDKWLYCIKHQSELSEQPAELKGEIFDELFEITDINTLTEEDMKSYKDSFKRCYGLELAKDYAREQGMEEGMQQGRQDTAKKFLAMGFSIEQVAQGTGLDIAIIKTLSN
jgi:predicted transposase/invertase (TIGR01784 family)